MGQKLPVEALFDAIAAIQTAAVDPVHWPMVAQILNNLVPGSAFGMIVHTDGPELAPIPFASGWPDDYVASYAAYYHSINPYPPLLRDVPHGAVAKAGDIVCPRWQKRQEYFNDWAKPAGNFTHGASMTMARGHNLLARLAYDIAYERKEDEDFAEKILLLIGPHVRQALEINARLAEADRIKSAGLALIERLSGAAFLIYADSTVDQLNARAQEVLGKATLLRQSPTGSLCFVSARADQDFRNALARAVDPAKGVAQSFAISTSRGPNVGHVLPLETTRSFALLSARRQALLIIDNDAKPASPSDLLMSLYGLSRTEAEVANSVAAGLSIREIAEQRRVSLHTLRHQVAAVFQKTGTGRQAELVALIAQLSPRLDMSGL